MSVGFILVGSAANFRPNLEINGRKRGAIGAGERSEHAPSVRRLTVHCIGVLDGAANAADFGFGLL